jgi:hypothetical protein
MSIQPLHTDGAHSQALAEVALSAQRVGASTSQPTPQRARLIGGASLTSTRPKPVVAESTPPSQLRTKTAVSGQEFRTASHVSLAWHAARHTLCTLDAAGHAQKAHVALIGSYSRVTSASYCTGPSGSGRCLVVGRAGNRVLQVTVREEENGSEAQWREALEQQTSA